ncbi:nSTAND1 domain-containing NTPase [Streptomyces sp. NPDC001709]
MTAKPPPSALQGAVAQILSSDGSVAGAGFLAGPRSEKVLLTCSHVVEKAGYGPRDQLWLVFPQLEGSPRVQGKVLPTGWTDPQDQDVAVIRLTELPLQAVPLPLGTADGCSGHRLSTFGFPPYGDEGEDGKNRGNRGQARALGVKSGSSDYPVLDLDNANSLTVGFSGAPLVDNRSGLVIGMVRSISVPDGYDRGQNTAQAVPTETLRTVWPAVSPGAGMRPYLGLEPFTELDARWFHGRGKAVEEAVEKLTSNRTHGLLMVGPSGSGKSSLVRAGVLKRLESQLQPGGGRWVPLYLEHPGQNLAEALDQPSLFPGASADIATAVQERLSALGDRDRLVLFIDQFEEILAAAGPQAGLSPHARSAVDQLTRLLRSGVSATIVMIMRSDFMPRLENVAGGLLGQVGDPWYVPSILTRNDLHAIITEPAAAAGVTWEPADLPIRIADDVLAAANGRSATHLLPLLEITLSHLWDMRRDDRLVQEAYGTNGIAESLNAWGRKAMKKLPDRHQQGAAQRMLAAMVRRDDSRRIPDVRDKLPLDELRTLAGRANMDEILAVLAAERLVVTRGHDPNGRNSNHAGEPEGAYAELIHDYLLTGWDDLSTWVDQYEEFNSWRHRAAHQQALWKRQRKRSDLLHGSDLDHGMKWQAEGHLRPNSDIAEFVRRSRKWRVMLRSVTAVALSLALITVTTLAISRQIQLERTQQALRESRQEQRHAVALQLTARAEQLRPSNPWLALQLGLAAYHTDPEPSVRASLVNTMTTTRLDTSLPGRPLGFTRGGSLLVARGGSRLITRNNPPTRLQIATRDLAPGATAPKTRVLSGFPPSEADVSYVGHLLIAIDGSGIRLWRLAGKARLVPTSTKFDRNIRNALLSEDDRHVVVEHQDQTVTVWDVTDPSHPRRSGPLFRIPSDDSDPPVVRAFSPDGRLVATTSERTLTLWDTGTHWHPIATLRMPNLPRRSDGPSFYDAGSVAFSPDGHTLAAVARGAVVLWDITRTDRPVRLGTPLPGDAAAFGPGGTSLATADENGAITLWDLGDRARPRRTDHFPAPQNGGVVEVRYTPDGTHLVIGYSPAEAHAGCGFVLDYECHQGPFDNDYTVVWNLRHPAWPAPLGKTLLTTASPFGLAISPDGHTAVTARPDGTLAFTDITDADHPFRTSTLRPGFRGRVTALAYRPDGRVLAVGGERGAIELWKVSTVARPARVRAVAPFNRPVTLLRFSSDGKTLEAADALESIGWTTAAQVPSSFWAMWFTPLAPRVDVDPLTGTLARVGPRDWPYIPTADMSYQVELWVFDGEVGPRPGSGGSMLTGPGSTGSTVAFSPRGHVLAVGGRDGTLALWDISGWRAGHLYNQNLPVSGHQGEVTAIAYSPDGSTIATGAADGTVLIWAPSGDGPLRLSEPERAYHGRVTALVFTTDGRELLTTGADGNVRLWNTGALADLRRAPDAQACTMAGTGLGKNSWTKFMLSQPYAKTCR